VHALNVDSSTPPQSPSKWPALTRLGWVRCLFLITRAFFSATTADIDAGNNGHNNNYPA
jgi:hypothetical protein